MKPELDLRPVADPGWRLGFANLLARENGKWWRGRRWWTQLLLWITLLDGTLAFVLFAMPAMMAATGEPMPDNPIVVGLTLFFGLATVGTAIGAIILCHAQIVDEKRSGTAAWVLSKPVSRDAFVLARLAADGAAMLIIMVVIPAAVAYVLVSLSAAAPYPLRGGFAAGMGILSLHLLFYLTLTLLAGVLAATTTVVLAASMGFLLLGMLARGLAGPLTLVTPWLLGDVAAASALGNDLPSTLWLPPAATAALTMLFGALAVALFRRREL